MVCNLKNKTNNHIRLDKINNDYIHQKVRAVAYNDDKMRKDRSPEIVHKFVNVKLS